MLSKERMFKLSTLEQYSIRLRKIGEDTFRQVTEIEFVQSYADAIFIPKLVKVDDENNEVEYDFSDGYLVELSDRMNVKLYSATKDGTEVIIGDTLPERVIAPGKIQVTDDEHKWLLDEIIAIPYALIYGYSAEASLWARAELEIMHTDCKYRSHNVTHMKLRDIELCKAQKKAHIRLLEITTDIEEHGLLPDTFFEQMFTGIPMTDYLSINLIEKAYEKVKTAYVIAKKEKGSTRAEKEAALQYAVYDFIVTGQLSGVFRKGAENAQSELKTLKALERLDVHIDLG